jgi:putative salt-induced outer membrane protein
MYVAATSGKLRRKYMRLSTIAVAIMLFCQLGLADQIVLNNGDRLTGTIVKSDGKELVIKTDYAGEVTVQWSAIKDVDSAAPLHVESKEGQTAVGVVKTEDGKLDVQTVDKGEVAVAKDSVSLMRSQSEQAAYEQTLHPDWLHGWTGGTNVSFALTRGNSETKNLALAFTADRKTLHDHLGLYANSVYATNDAPTATPSTTANAVEGGARYDHNLNPRLFAFVAGDFQSDGLQQLDLRSVFSGGLGFHMIKSERTTLDLLGGGNYTREKYDTFSRNVGGLTLGEELATKLGASTELTQKLYFYPDLTETGEYRATFNFGTVTKISKWLGWQNAFGDIYVTNPPPGTRQNDVLLTTGLNFSFKR